VNLLPLGNIQTIALANVVSLVFGIAVYADDNELPERFLLADMLAIPSPFEENESDGFATSFGIRKGRGVQVVRPIEVNDRIYELNLSGPIVKSGTRKKSFGLSFELRF
jgi:hypothetical protein